jgi:hypothetical protein
VLTYYVLKRVQYGFISVCGFLATVQLARRRSLGHLDRSLHGHLPSDTERIINLIVYAVRGEREDALTSYS